MTNSHHHYQHSGKSQNRHTNRQNEKRCPRRYIGRKAQTSRATLTATKPTRNKSRIRVQRRTDRLTRLLLDSVERTSIQLAAEIPIASFSKPVQASRNPFQQTIGNEFSAPSADVVVILTNLLRQRFWSSRSVLLQNLHDFVIDGFHPVRSVTAHFLKRRLSNTRHRFVDVTDKCMLCSSIKLLTCYKNLLSIHLCSMSVHSPVTGTIRGPVALRWVHFRKQADPVLGAPARVDSRIHTTEAMSNDNLRGLNFPDRQRASTDELTCACGALIEGVEAVAPGTHEFYPCGCPANATPSDLAGEAVDRGRRMATDGGESESDWYVVQHWYTDPVTVAAGPFDDHADASVTATSLTPTGAVIPASQLAFAVKNRGRALNWASDVERPNALENHDQDPWDPWCDFCQMAFGDDGPDWKIETDNVTGWFCTENCADQWRSTGTPERVGEQPTATGGSDPEQTLKEAAPGQNLELNHDRRWTVLSEEDFVLATENVLQPENDAVVFLQELNQKTFAQVRPHDGGLSLEMETGGEPIEHVEDVTPEWKTAETNDTDDEPEIRTDGGTITCEDCGDQFAEGDAKALMRPGEDAEATIICPDCQVKHPYDRQYAPADPAALLSEDGDCR